MSMPARTPAAGLPAPAWPSRPVPPTVPSRPAGDRTGAQPPVAWPAPPAPTRPPAAARPPATARPAAAAAPVVATPAPGTPVVVPAEEVPLDPRSIARASLAAGRNRSLWWTMSGIVAAVAVAFVTDAVVGTYALALLLLAFAVVRAVGRAPGPVALAVRSKALDVLVLAGSAVVLVVLASVLPPR